MEFALNLAPENFAAFCILAFFASLLTRGAKRVRLVGWIALWVLLTPVRPASTDIPLMILGWMATEVLYGVALRYFARRHAVMEKEHE